MEIVIRSLIRVFVRKAINQTLKSQDSSDVLPKQLLDTLELRLPQLEARVFNPEDTYLLANCLRKCLEFDRITQSNISTKRLQTMLTKLEGIEQDSISNLDANHRNRIQTEAERINYLPDLAFAIQAFAHDVNVDEASARKAKLRKRGNLLMLSALFACGSFFGLFAYLNENVAEDISNAIAFATLCLPSILFFTGIVFIVQGNSGKDDLEAKRNAKDYAESKRHLLERIYGTDKSRYSELYTNHLRSVDALLSRTQNQDLRSLFPY